MFDPDGRHIGHDGEQVEVVLAEFVHEVRRVQIDETDHAVVGLQRHGDHAANLLLHDAHLLGEIFVQPGVAHQQRCLVLDDPIAHRAADSKSLAACGPDHQLLSFERHEHAARRAHGLDGEIHDQVEQLGERQVAGQFASRAD